MNDPVPSVPEPLREAARRVLAEFEYAKSNDEPPYFRFDDLKLLARHALAAQQRAETPPEPLREAQLDEWASERAAYWAARLDDKREADKARGCEMPFTYYAGDAVNRAIRAVRQAYTALATPPERAETPPEPLRDFVEFVHTWAKAYPEDVFPRPDFKKAAAVLEAAGMTLDSISAANMHHVITKVRDKLDAALATTSKRVEPLTLEFIDQHIGSDEGDREAVIALVREVERAHGIGVQS